MNPRRSSLSDDRRLLEVVRGLPILYNPEEYSSIRNNDVLKDVWREVAAAVGKDEESCKKRWRDIRDHYYKIKRKQQKDKRKKPKWVLYELLSFLNNVKRKKLRYTNMGEEPLEVYAAGDIIDEPETSVKLETDYTQTVKSDSHRLEYVAVPPHMESPMFMDPPTGGTLPLMDALADKAEEDDVDVFMRSVALTVKRFPPKTRAEAKLKILSVVTDLEFPNKN